MRLGLDLRLVAAAFLELSWSGVEHGAPGDRSHFWAWRDCHHLWAEQLPHALIVQSDGKLVAAGVFSSDGVNHVPLIRYLPYGQWTWCGG
jgi:hypothetical protein